MGERPNNRVLSSPHPICVEHGTIDKISRVTSEINYSLFSAQKCDWTELEIPQISLFFSEEHMISEMGFATNQSSVLPSKKRRRDRLTGQPPLIALPCDRSLCQQSLLCQIRSKIFTFQLLVKTEIDGNTPCQCAIISYFRKGQFSQSGFANHQTPVLSSKTRRRDRLTG